MRSFFRSGCPTEGEMGLVILMLVMEPGPQYSSFLCTGVLTMERPSRNRDRTGGFNSPVTFCSADGSNRKDRRKYKRLPYLHMFHSPVRPHFSPVL